MYCLDDIVDFEEMFFVLIDLVCSGKVWVIGSFDFFVLM